jgi:hypothetical protein
MQVVGNMEGSFLDLVAARYGNPRARFAVGALKARQEVMLLLDQKTVEAVALGRRDKKKRERVRYIDDNGRVWNLTVSPSKILIRW